MSEAELSWDLVYGRPGGVSGYPRAWCRSVSCVRIPPSAYSYIFVETFSCAQVDLRKARERESAALDENRRAEGLLNPMRDKHGRQEPGGRDDTCDHGLSRSWKV